MEMNIRMGFNHKLQLSPTVYNSLQSFAEFKVDFHHMYIKARKDPMKAWKELPYLVMEDVIFIMLESGPLEWCILANSTMEVDNSAA